MATKVKGKVELSVSFALGLIALAAAYILWAMSQGPGHALLPNIGTPYPRFERNGRQA